jgi:Tol biopolymer transport system component
VRGDPPGNSSSPSIQGDLMLVDVTSGEEQQIHTPARVSGTLAWSPDGTKIACALLIPSQDGALIHEVDVASGAVRQLQLPRAFAKARLGSTWHGIRNRTRFFSRRSGAGRRKYARCRRETRP